MTTLNFRHGKKAPVKKRGHQQQKEEGESSFTIKFNAGEWSRNGIREKGRRRPNSEERKLKSGGHA